MMLSIRKLDVLASATREMEGRILRAGADLQASIVGLVAAFTHA